MNHFKLRIYLIRLISTVSISDKIISNYGYISTFAARLRGDSHA